MGIENRDYTRAAPGRGYAWGDSTAPGTQAILSITVAAYLLQLFVGRAFEFWLVLYPLEAPGFVYPWQLLTYGFLHSVREPMHILFNMIGLWSFGRWMEWEKGTKEFVTFYLVGLICGGLGHWAYCAISGEPTAAIGASGSIMAIIGWCAYRYPRQEILVMFVFPMQLRFAAILFIALDAMGAGHNISHGAHLGGIAWGLGYAFSGIRLSDWSGRFGIGRRWVKNFGSRAARSTPRHPTNLRVYSPEPSSPTTNVELDDDVSLQERVDKILAKVAVEGEANLTPQERATLVAAADVYKRKRTGM